LDALHVVTAEEPAEFISEAGGFGAEFAEFGQASFESGGTVEFRGEGEACGEFAGDEDGLGGGERDGRWIGVG
jgi:hypothetical protein